MPDLTGQSIGCSQNSLSRKKIAASLGVLAIMLIVVFGTGCTDQKLTAISPAPATDTTEPPTATIFSPSATPEPSATIIPSRTSWPTQTPTSLPAWVADFAEPILADINSREPDFQDDFERKSNFWVPRCSAAGKFKVANGVMTITGCSYVDWTRNYDNFVAAFDLRLLNAEDSFKFRLRKNSSFEGCGFQFHANGDFDWQCRYPPNELNYHIENSEVEHILIIVQDNKFALYVNERPIDMIQVDALRYGNISELSYSGQIDNFKLWQIR